MTQKRWKCDELCIFGFKNPNLAQYLKFFARPHGRMVAAFRNSAKNICSSTLMEVSKKKLINGFVFSTPTCMYFTHYWLASLIQSTNHHRLVFLLVFLLIRFVVLNILSLLYRCTAMTRRSLIGRDECLLASCPLIGWQPWNSVGRPQIKCWEGNCS